MLGVQRGDHVKGVHELKNHLTYLGYLNYNDQLLEFNNTFDVSLELALRKYQEFYSINATGILDVNTIAQMQKPRCGLPDFYNPIHENPAYRMISRYTFFSGRPKWLKRRLRYGFNKNVKDEVKRPLERALKAWASSTPFKFERVGSLNEAEIRISFMRGYHGDVYPFGPPEAGLAHTFAPPDGRVHFNAAQKWSSTGIKNAYDIQTVGMHELGHVLGLGHSRSKQAIMYPTIDEGEIKGLNQDDINGIKDLYKFK